MATDFEYTFPAVRGIQAGSEYYITMCPLRDIERLFKFDDEDIFGEFSSDFCDLSINSCWIGSVAFEYLNGERVALLIGE